MKIWVDGIAHTLRLKVTILGRDPRADIPVIHAEVSRKHAVVVALGEDRYLLMDFKSANGTKLNGRRIEATELRDGDRIDLAGALLDVEEERRRVGSLAATGRFKTLLEMEGARAGADGGHEGAGFWQEHLTELSSVLPKLEALRKVRDLDEAAHETLRICLEGVNADRGILLLLDDEGSSLRLKSEVGYPDGQGIRKNLHQALLDEAIDNDRIVATGPEFLAQVFNELRARGEWMPNVSSAIAAPLVLCGRAVGAMCLDRRQDKPPFQARQRARLRFLTQLASSPIATLLLQQLQSERLGQVQILEVFLSRTGIGNCEICGTSLAEEGLPLVQCVECETKYHEDCWSFLGKCAIFACECHLATRHAEAGPPG